MKTLLAVLAVLGAVTLTGCELPDMPSMSGTGTSDGTSFTDPRETDLPYSGGEITGPCGLWEAATPQDAEKLAAIHRDCLKDPAKYDMGW